jgi:putative endonuclease
LAAHLERGRWGEELAARWYLRNGYAIVARNWRCREGELDLVVRRGRPLVFCEVKARAGPGLGGPYEAVTASKRRKLRHLADAFVAAVRPRGSTYRFDVASVTWRPGRAPEVHLFQDAF